MKESGHIDTSTAYPRQKPFLDTDRAAGYVKRPGWVQWRKIILWSCR